MDEVAIVLPNCCLGVSDDEDPLVFQTVGQIVAELTVGYDLVPTDVAAALRILGSPEKLIQPENGKVVDHEIVKEAAYWMRYSVSIYGWPLYVFSRGM